VRREIAPAPAPSGPNRVRDPADGDMMNPDLGHHCAKCKRLDFLPSRCDCCLDTFCAECSGYDAHDCPGQYKKNRTVPVCPLCQEAVPCKPGEDANAKMERHIAGGCAKPVKQAVFTHRCNYGKCKKKELVQCVCKECGLNHCIKHRQPDAHRCGQAKAPTAKAAPPATAAPQHPLAASLAARRAHEQPASAAAAAAERRAQAATAAMTRQRKSATSATEPIAVPPTVAAAPLESEDEELQRALALSMQAVEQASTRPVGDMGTLEPLVAMGYSPAAAAEAMAASGGDLQQAALLLMENASATDAAAAHSGGLRATA
jgi:hypothetical protein